MTSEAVVETYRRALFRARIEADRMKVDLLQEKRRGEDLEEENEALREMVEWLCKA